MSVETGTIAGVLAEARRRLDGNSDSPRLDAEILLAHALQVDRSHLLAWPERAVPREAWQRFAGMIEQRCGGVPTAYLTGEREFWSLPLKVTPATLVPRPETETLVAQVLAGVNEAPHTRIAELGTGSGAIAVALATERPAWHLVATDASSEALVVARANAQRLNAAHIEFRCGHWCEALGTGETFSAIVSNPPYVADDDPHLAALHAEPGQALAAGHDGLDAIREIAPAARAHLRPGGQLWLEHGAAQGHAVRTLLESLGYADVHTINDDAGLERITSGHWPGTADTGSA